ncbi:MAG: DUF6896 domain-containing protein [Culicoidibacterales bacterium]
MKKITKKLEKEALKSKGNITWKTKLEIKRLALSRVQLLAIVNQITKYLLAKKRLEDYYNFTKSFTLFVMDTDTQGSFFSCSFDKMIFILIRDYVVLSNKLLSLVLTKNEEIGAVSMGEATYFYAIHGVHCSFKRIDAPGIQLEVSLENPHKIDIYFMLKYITTYKKYSKLSKLFQGENPMKIHELFSYYRNSGYLSKVSAVEYLFW